MRPNKAAQGSLLYKRRLTDVAKKLFTADPFTPTQFDSAEDKARFANQFVYWVESGFSERSAYWPKWFYKRLSMSFGHIAHYNQGGFYNVWASDNESRLAFLERTANPPFHGGDPHYTYSDVERVLGEWIRRSGLIEHYRNLVAAETEASERAMLARLKAKYE